MFGHRSDGWMLGKLEQPPCSVPQPHQVIERPPAEVFRFVATDHFQNHPKWDPAVTYINKTSPGPMGVGTTTRGTL